MSEIVILTGAGVSAESGLGTFRDADGLWTRVRLEDVATPEGYARDPDRVLDFYNDRRRNCLGAEPNPAHVALARLQRAHPGRVTIVTQNSDDLHERGGAGEVIHMHGELLSAMCAHCAGRTRPWRGDMSRADSCAECGAAGGLRPDVVWFGEIPYHMEEIEARLAGAALFVAIGTSGAVYPAAGFVAEAARRGARTLEINLEPSETAGLFDDRIEGPASETVPGWVERVLAGDQL
jgi:NAD-dependent deacetylase